MNRLGLQSAILVTEFGCGADADERLLTPTIDAQDRAMIPAIIWPWKNNCFSPGCQSSWSLYDSGISNGTDATQNGPERPNRVRLLSRVHPRGVVGQLKNYFYNTTTSSFIMAATCRNKTLLSINNETLIYIPRRLNNSVINVTGQAILNGIIKNPDLSRLVVINPTCDGDYYVIVANNTDLIHEVVESRPTTHEMKPLMADTYQLYRQFHRAAVEVGQTFAKLASKLDDKKRALQMALEINAERFMQFNKYFLHASK